MKSRYFRHLFQGENDGIIQAGSTWDDALDIETSYVYLSSSYSRNQRRKSNKNVGHLEVRAYDGLFEEGERLDLLILGSYTLPDLFRLLHILDRTKTRTLVMPYLTPIQRVNLANNIPCGFRQTKELINFIDYPYTSLRAHGVENIYFLYGNGAPIEGDLNQLKPGHHFERLDLETLKWINNMEKEPLPVVKGGYILENQWLFYFGVFGPDIGRINQFVTDNMAGVKDESTHLESLLGKFGGQFGADPYGSIALFHGPVHDDPMDADSLMMGKPFDRERGCKALIPTNGRTCALQCQRDYDYEYLQRCKDKKRNVSRMGFWLLGNVNLRRYFSEVNSYFGSIQKKVRAITVPNCGKREYWSEQLPKSMAGEDHIYWVLPVEDSSRMEVLVEIISFQAYNRHINISKKFGYCFSGYLVSRDLDYIG